MRRPASSWSSSPSRPKHRSSERRPVRAPLGTRGGDTTSDALTYWRHEFRSYKQDHRRNDVHRTDDDADWHADGTPHIDHDRIVVAISGMLMSGSRPAPGATPPFELVVQSVPSEAPLQ